MSSQHFKIVEHKIPCQHVREYPRALAHAQEDMLHLAVKQYIPLDNPNPQPGDVTIIGAHANGFPKELYEPLWEELLDRAKRRKLRIRGIWIADVAQQGQSGILNEELLGNDPSWMDHPRDLLHMINLKRDEMPRPLVGIGHSMGGNNLVNLAYMHPRLFTTFILIDPVIQLHSSTPPGVGLSPALLSTHRRDIWPSREDAAESYKKSPFYKAWDARVLDRWIRYGLRDLPTVVHPDEAVVDGKRKATLTTTKHQEVFTFLRPNFENYGTKTIINRKTHADLDSDIGTIAAFYRPEPPRTFFRLGELRPSVLYIFGGKSDMSSPAAREAKVAKTGVGVGGSGGRAAGRVKEVTFEDIGHLIAMEAVDRTADTVVEWLDSEMDLWSKDEEEFQKAWSQISMQQKRTVDQQWIEMTGPLPRKQKSDSKRALMVVDVLTSEVRYDMWWTSLHGYGTAVQLVRAIKSPQGPAFANPASRNAKDGTGKSTLSGPNVYLLVL